MDFVSYVFNRVVKAIAYFLVLWALVRWHASLVVREDPPPGQTSWFTV